MARDYFSPRPQIFIDEDYTPPRPRRRVADVPGTVPGLAEAYATPAPLSRFEIERNAERARQMEAERFNTEALAEGQRTSPSRIIRELGDIASMYGVPGLESAADVAANVGATGGGDTSYDPLALGTAAVPLADEALGAGEHFATGRPYREAQAAWEQRSDEAQRRSPGSAFVGKLAQGAVAAPLVAEMTMARGAAVGAPLGAAGGYLGSEGESGTDRALATLRGGAAGLGYGATAGGLMQGGRLLAAQEAPGLFGRLGRSALGAGLEAEGAGIGSAALESGGRAGSEEQMRDALGAAPANFGLGAGLGLVSGALGSLARRRSVPGLADEATDIAPTDIDETALEPSFGDVPDDGGLSVLTGTRSQRNADMARIRAAGAIDRGVRNRLVRAFDPGNAERGLAQAARVARESGISPPGEFQSLDTTLERAVRARAASQRQLGELHREVGEAGAVMRGDALAAPLEAEASRLSQMRLQDDAVRARIAALRARADDLRFGSMGETPNRAAYDEIRALETTDPGDVLPDEIANLPGLEREVVGVPERLAVAPQTVPYQAGRDRMSEVVRRTRMFDRANLPQYGTEPELLAMEHRAFVPERNEAARRVLGERYATEMRPANETFRFASTVAPENVLPNSLIADPGQLTSRIAQAVAGGNLSPSGETQRLLERVSRQFEPSINALLAEHAASRAPSRIGDYASHLRLALPSPSAAGIVSGGMIGPGIESQRATDAVQARALAEASQDPAVIQAIDDAIFGTGAELDEEEAARLRDIDEAIFGAQP